MFCRRFIQVAVIFAAGFVVFGFLAGCKSNNEEKPSATDRNEKPEIDTTFREGLLAPDFELKDLSGSSHKLSQFRGKLVLLNFWATWCPPCVHEMPALERLYQKYRPLGLEVVAVSTDPPPADGALRDFIREKNISFTVLRDSDMSLVETYGVTGFPETLFVDRDGKFVTLRDAEVDKKVLRILSDRKWDEAPYAEEVEALLRNSPKNY